MSGKIFGPRQRGGRCNRKRVQLRFEAMESRMLLATTFLVTNTNDDGAGSLRQVILDANPAAQPPPRSIFKIGTGGPQTIFPLSALPGITKSVTIDGTSQPGYTGYPLIEIDGGLCWIRRRWADDLRGQQHGPRAGNREIQWQWD